MGSIDSEIFRRVRPVEIIEAVIKPYHGLGVGQNDNRLVVDGFKYVTFSKTEGSALTQYGTVYLPESVM